MRHINAQGIELLAFRPFYSVNLKKKKNHKENCELCHIYVISLYTSRKVG